MPVHLLHSAWSTCSKRGTSGPQSSPLSSALLFLASCGKVATKMQVSSTVRQAASLLGMPLETLTGARRDSGAPSWPREPCTSHPVVSMCGGPSWGPKLSLRYVRPSPLAQSLSLETLLERDLQAAQKQTLAARAEFSSLASSTLAS